MYLTQYLVISRLLKRYTGKIVQMVKKSLRNEREGIEENKYTIKVTPKAYEDVDVVHGYMARDLYNFSANFRL